MTSSPRPRLNRTVADLAPSGIREFFELVQTVKNVVSLGVGEPDFATPWHVCDEVYNSLRHGDTHYTSNAGTPELRQEISDLFARLYGVQYDPAQEVLVTVGVSEAIDLAIRTVVSPGDEVIIPDPSFVAYSACVKLAGGTPVLAPMREADDFKLRADTVRSLLTDRTRAILLGFPNNPTGSVMTRAELLPVARLAEERDLLVLSDETYDRLTYAGQHACFAELPGMWDRTILLNGFSKSYAMTGWRIGYACGPADLLDAMTRVHSYTMMCASTPAQVAATQALRGGEADVQRMKTTYDERRRVLVNGLRDAGLRCFEPLGAFYVFPNIESTGLTSKEFCRRLVEERQVAVVPGTAFGPAGEGYVRATYATSMKNLKKVIGRIGGFVASL